MCCCCCKTNAFLNETTIVHVSLLHVYLLNNVPQAALGAKHLDEIFNTFIGFFKFLLFHDVQSSNRHLLFLS